MNSQSHGKVDYLNPPTLHANPAFSQVVVASGPVTTIYVGGQNAVDASGAIVGVGDIAQQVAQIMANVEAALAAAGAGFEHVVKWTVYILAGQPLGVGFGAFQRAWADRPNPPAVSVLFVAGLANPAFLAEVDAVAVVPT